MFHNFDFTLLLSSVTLHAVLIKQKAQLQRVCKFVIVHDLRYDVYMGRVFMCYEFHEINL